MRVKRSFQLFPTQCRDHLRPYHKYDDRQFCLFSGHFQHIEKMVLVPIKCNSFSSRNIFSLSQGNFRIQRPFVLFLQQFPQIIETGMAIYSQQNFCLHLHQFQFKICKRLRSYYLLKFDGFFTHSSRVDVKIPRSKMTLSVLKSSFLTCNTLLPKKH